MLGFIGIWFSGRNLRVGQKLYRQLEYRAIHQSKTVDHS